MKQTVNTGTLGRSLVVVALCLSLPAAAQNPERALDHLAKAKKHCALGKLEKMRKEAEKARTDDPSLGEAYALLGMYYYRTHDLDIAETFFKTSIEKDPNTALPRAYLGNLLYESGDEDEALDQWNLAVRLDSTNPEANASVALGFFLMGKQEEAIRYYREALRWDSRYQDVEFLADFNQGAAWGAKKLKAARELLLLVPPPRSPYRDE